MSSSYFSLFDMAIAGVPVLAFCAWQLISINREIARDKAKAESPESAGHPVGEHGLDDG
jgi:hypothetical protein